MSDAKTVPDKQSGRCTIRVKGHIDARWSAWFDGLTVTSHGDGTTLIHGPVPDQAALFGLLQKLRDIGLPLLTVVRVEPTDDPHQDTSTP